MVVWLLVRNSFSVATEFFFWKDDWFLKWSALYNPNSFYKGFNYWLLRFPEFYLRVLITDSVIWQRIGLVMKFINSIIFYFFIQTLFKNKKMAVAGSMLYASYSGGMEIYTWAILNTLLIPIVLGGIIAFDKFLQTQKIRFLIGTGISFLLSNILYFGRTLGMIPFFLFWFALYEMNSTKLNYKKLKISILFLLSTLSFFVLNFFAGFISGQNWKPQFFLEGLQQYPIFFASLGNLLRIPFSRHYEIGGLTEFSAISMWIGIGGLILCVVTTSLFTYTKRQVFYWIAVFLSWAYFLYFFNWMYGGGGVSTLVGSAHRYLALSAMSLLIIWSLLLSYLRGKWFYVILFLLISMNLDYSHFIVGNDLKVRDRIKIESLYKEINQILDKDDDVQVLILDTPNELKSFVVQGWYPFTYAYYKGLSGTNKFPTIIAESEAGQKWICADKSEKQQIANMAGFVDYRNDTVLYKEHIYWFTISEDGNLKDRTLELYSNIQDCKNVMTETSMQQ